MKTSRTKKSKRSQRFEDLLEDIDSAIKTALTEGDLNRAADLIAKLDSERNARERELKARLLGGAAMECGRFAIELKLRPGKSDGSKDPDDYDLLIHQVS